MSTGYPPYFAALDILIYDLRNLRDDTLERRERGRATCHDTQKVWVVRINDTAVVQFVLGGNTVGRYADEAELMRDDGRASPLPPQFPA